MKQIIDFTTAVWLMHILLYVALGLKITSVVEKSCIVATDKGRLDLSSLASSTQQPA